jgi:hypothetical protein
MSDDLFDLSDVRMASDCITIFPTTNRIVGDTIHIRYWKNVGECAALMLGDMVVWVEEVPDTRDVIGAAPTAITAQAAMHSIIRSIGACFILCPPVMKRPFLIVKGRRLEMIYLYYTPFFCGSQEFF